MSAVLELNDQSLCLYRDGELLASSPGYVLTLGKQVLFGSEAAAQSRLHPLSTNNEFWFRLNMTPLARPQAHFRHHADMAHAHLLHLSEISDYTGPVALAVPGSFSREQLGVLSGIVRHSPFDVRALLDGSVVAAASLSGHSQSMLHIDIQMHQAVLAAVLNDGTRVRREQVTAVPGAGWNHLCNTLVQTVTDAFISQCRFNPQHSAEWEQVLYNAVPEWLEAVQQGAREITVTIVTPQNRHEARVQVLDILADMEPTIQKIGAQLQQVLNTLSGTADVLLSARAALIPGLQALVERIRAIVAGDEMARVCARLASRLNGNDGAVPYITSVRLDEAPPVTTPAKHETPTHVLVDGYAWPLTAQQHLSDEEVARVLREHTPGDVIERNGRRLQLIRVQHGQQ